VNVSDPDTLSISGSTLSISGGNSVTLPSTPASYGTVTDAATITWNLSSTPTGQITLAGNRVLTVSSPSSGGVYIIRIIQDATGSRTITWPGTFKWEGGVPGVLSTTANAVDILTLLYDGTNYSAIISKNFF
jgi:hypothetical protein